jgi:cyanophycinase
MIGRGTGAVKGDSSSLASTPLMLLRRRTLLLLSAGIALVAAAGCASLSSSRDTASRPDPAATTLPGRGRLFIVGGGPQPPALVREFVDLAGGAGRARIVVFAMASSDGAASGEEKARDLRALGATAVNVFVNSAQANTDSVARLLDDATGVWFGGGDQVLLARALHGTRTERAIHARYAAGAVIGGTSAGAAVMSALMITGDERHPGGARPPSDSSDAFMTIARDNIVVDSGFALLTNAIVDQHFVRRKRHNRLLSLVLEHPVRLGVGIDESTALVVEPDGRWRVAGASVAIVYDARRAVITPSAATLGGTGIVIHVLPAGSGFDPASGVATLPTTR